MLCYGLTSWFENSRVKYKAQICSLVKTAGKIMEGVILTTPHVISEQSIITQQAISILSLLVC